MFSENARIFEILLRLRTFVFEFFWCALTLHSNLSVEYPDINNLAVGALNESFKECRMQRIVINNIHVLSRRMSACSLFVDDDGYLSIKLLHKLLPKLQSVIMSDLSLEDMRTHVSEYIDCVEEVNDLRYLEFRSEPQMTSQRKDNKLSEEDLNQFLTLKEYKKTFLGVADDVLTKKEPVIKDSAMQSLRNLIGDDAHSLCDFGRYFMAKGARKEFLKILKKATKMKPGTANAIFKSILVQLQKVVMTEQYRLWLQQLDILDVSILSNVYESMARLCAMGRTIEYVLDDNHCHRIVSERKYGNATKWFTKKQEAAQLVQSFSRSVFERKKYLKFRTDLKQMTKKIQSLLQNGVVHWDNWEEKNIADFSNVINGGYVSWSVF